MYFNECLTKQSIERTLDCLYKGIHLYVRLTQSHRPEEAIPDSYNKREPGFSHAAVFAVLPSIFGSVIVDRKYKNLLTQKMGNLAFVRKAGSVIFAAFVRAIFIL